MKKLTAGIFTVLLGLVSINSAEAAVASQGYVDAKFESVGGNVDTLTQTVADNKAAAENAVKTEKEAREAADSALGTRVTTAEGKITTLQGDENVVGSVAKSIADAIAGIDVAEAGAEGSFISTVSQADGSITAGATPFVAEINDASKDSTIAPQTKAVATYVDAQLNVVNQANSELAQKVTNLENAVTAEDALIDQFADYKTANDAALAAEVKARGDADTALQNALSAEVAAREATDDVVSAMETAYKTADDALDKAYKAADQALKTDLEGKIQTAAGSAGQVASDLAAYEAKTDKAIEDEIAARQQADADTLAAAEADATSKADAAQAAAEETAAADATAKASAAQAAAEATAAADAKSKADKALEDAKAYADQKGTALDTALKQYADQAGSDAIATAGTNADTKISNLNLNELSRVPADCADAKNYCVLTSDGSKYLWEVITRDVNEVQPQGTEIPSVK